MTPSGHGAPGDREITIIAVWCTYYTPRLHIPIHTNANTNQREYRGTEACALARLEAQGSGGEVWPQNYFRHSEPAQTSLSILTSLQSHAEVPRIHPLFGRGGDVPKGARGEALRPIFGAGTLSLGANNFNRLRVGALPLAAGGEGTGGCRGRREGGPRLTPPATHAHRRRFAAAAPSVPSPRTLAWV